MQVFNNKVVVITGGSDGIGKAMVEQFLNVGAKVATCGRNQLKLQKLKHDNLTKPLYTSIVDVSKEEDCKRFIEATVDIFGTIDILINNAGISMNALFAEAQIDVIKKIVDTNFYGTVYCTHYALPTLLKTKGIIVGVSSIAGYRGVPGRTGYNASKFALQGFLESLRTELLYTGVHVMWVCPGFTISNIRQAALSKDGTVQGDKAKIESNAMPTEKCARMTIEAIAKRKRTLIYTSTDKRTIFISKWFPKLADKLVHRFYFENGVLKR